MTGNLASVAAEAVQAGGAVLRERFEDGTTVGDYSATDVKTEADRLAKGRVLSVIEESYPDHRISADTVGRNSPNMAPRRDTLSENNRR